MTVLQDVTNISEIAKWSCPDARLIQAAGKTRTPEWYELRRTGIGASELAAIRNESPFTDATPYGVWLDKIEGRELEETDAMHYGSLLEDTVARDWAERAGLSVRNVGMYQSRTHPHALCNPDRLTSDGGVLEVKTSNAFTKAWANGATPLHVVLQAIWLLAVTGRSHCWIICLIGGQRLEVRRIERNDVECLEHLDFGEAWWAKHITGFEPPEMGRPVALEPLDKSLIVEAALPEATIADRRRWDEIAQQITDLKEELDLIKARADEEMGPTAKRVRALGVDVFQRIERRGSNKFLRPKFKRDHPDLEAQYSEVGPPTRYVARVGGNGDE